MLADDPCDDGADEDVHAREGLLEALEAVAQVSLADLYAARTQVGDRGLREGRGAYNGGDALDGGTNGAIGGLGLYGEVGYLLESGPRTKLPDARRASVMFLPVMPVAPTTRTRGFWLAMVASSRLEFFRGQKGRLYSLSSAPPFPKSGESGDVGADKAYCVSSSFHERARESGMMLHVCGIS